ncbi:MAG: hypothetical protein R6U32_00775 [Candidatus Woesearchaeota archaeon]
MTDDDTPRPRIVQADSRGKIVIPNSIREKLGLSGKTDFSMYIISDEGLFLKPQDNPEMDAEGNGKKK